MNLLTPIAGFLIGYGGIMGYHVIDSTYKGEMPGPKSFGYFIGGMTLLSAATIYALGRTDKVFNAEGDSTYCKTYTSRSEFPGLHEGSDAMRFITYLEQFDVDGHTITVKNISAETKSDPNPIFDETWITFTICSEFEGSLKFWRKLLMKDLDAIADGKGKYDDLHRCIQTMAEGNEPSENWSMSAEGLSQFTPNELTQSSAIHGDFDHASLNYSGHQNMILKAESFDAEGTVYLGTCKICGKGPEAEGTIKSHLCRCDYHRDEARRLTQEGYDMPFPSPDRSFFCFDCAPSITSDMILSAEGNYNDFIEDMEGVMGKYGDMKDFDSGYNPQDNLLKARMVVEVDDEDFDNVDFDAETMMPENQCIICGGPYTGYGHNPEPIFPMSRGRCCDTCNATVVIPYRMGGMNFRFGEDFEAETTRRFRNRFDKTSKTGNPRSRAATGVKRGIWKNFFRKDAEDMSDELDMVMAQLYEIEDMKNPTPEDLTNYQNLLTRYYGMVRFNAEQKTARVRTMSGKPHTPRKLVKDKNIAPKEAAKRMKLEAESGQMCEVCHVNDDLPYDADHFKECRRCSKSVCLECWDEMEHDEKFGIVCGSCWVVLDNVAQFGAETFEAEVLARDWKWKGIKWTPEEEATLNQEEKEAIAEQLYNDWKEDLNS